MIIKPCGPCPFKKSSIKGNLGGFTVEETLETARSESSFICHKVRESNNEDECAGRLLFSSKTCKSFRNTSLEDQFDRGKTTKEKLDEAKNSSSFFIF